MWKIPWGYLRILHIATTCIDSFSSIKCRIFLFLPLPLSFHLIFLCIQTQPRIEFKENVKSTECRFIEKHWDWIKFAFEILKNELVTILDLCMFFHVFSINSQDVFRVFSFSSLLLLLLLFLSLSSVSIFCVCSRTLECDSQSMESGRKKIWRVLAQSLPSFIDQKKNV